MDRYKKAVVALSLDEKSDKALLSKVSSLFGASTEILLLHATEYMVSYEAAFGVRAGIDTEELLRQKAVAYLQELSGEFGFEKSSQEVVVGPPAANVAEYAQEQKADLIVMGSHSRHGLKHLLGSTADGVLHQASCDVLALHLD